MKGTVTTGDKGLIRSLNRRGTKSGKAVPGARKRRAYRDPSICDACGAVYTAKTWRQARRLPGAQGRGSLGDLTDVAGTKDDPRTLGHEHLRGREPESPAAAGDHEHPASQSEIHLSSVQAP